MKPFDLKQALAGAKVVTRDGREVTQMVVFDLAEPTYIVHAVVAGIVKSYTKDGEFDHTSKDHDNDLFMYDESKILEGWVNVYSDGFGSDVFASEKEAVEAAYTPELVTRIKIIYEGNVIC